MGYIDRGDDEPPDFGLAEHFQRDGTRWLYYRSGWKAPIPVSNEERDRAISWHENGMLAMFAIVMVMGVVMFFAPLPWPDVLPDGLQVAVAFAAMLLLLAVIWISIERWITSPFATRTPVGAPRDRDFLARRRLANTSWRRIIFGILAFAALAVIWMSGPGELNWLIWAVPLLISFYQAYQKWRFERRPAASTSA